MQVNTGKKSDVWEIEAVLKRAGFDRDVVECVEFDRQDNLVVSLQGPQAEGAAKALEAHKDKWNTHLGGPALQLKLV